MSRFPTDKHFSSWLSLSPNNKKSGGEILRSKTEPNKSNAAITMRLSVSSLYSERNDTALGAFFRRKRAHIGAPKAITSAANKLAKFIYTTLKKGREFQEMGAEKYLEKHKEQMVKGLTKKLGRMGFDVRVIS